MIGRLLLLLGLFALPAEAKVRFGVRAGGAYSALIQKVGDTYESGARFGFSVAGICEVPLPKRWSLRPEIAFVQQGGNYYAAPAREGMALYNKCHYYALQLPVNVAYTIPLSDIRLTPFAGPVFNWALFGKMSSRTTNPDLHFGMTEEKDLKPCDLGVSLGLTAEYNHFFFTVNALCGTIDRRAVKRSGESAVFQNDVTLSLGYFFH